ncbi:MAG: spermidine/putrescine ABC transporter substrate-binding protein [Chloroflexi bacterium]|nr:spermidine/putrescine ABC transporter substrate-binding protein [Chloroflexota bacterium]
MARLPLAVALVVTLALVACGAATPAPPTATSVPTPNATPIPRAATPAATASPVALRLLMHADDVDPALYELFSRETAITIIEETYTTDEEILAALQNRPGLIDLVIANDRTLPRLIGDGRLAPIEAAGLPNFAGVESRLKDLPFDRGNRYSVPFAWGTVGILYRTDQPLIIDSWSIVLDPARNKPLAGKVALLDDPQLGFGAVLKALGDPLNPTDSAAWTRARDRLAASRATIAVIDSSAWSNELLTGELAAAQAYSDDAAFAQSTNAALRFAVPREGAPLWMQNLAVPATSTHKSEARALVDFLLRPASTARTVSYTYSLSPVPEAYNRVASTLSAQLRESTIPSDETFRRSEFLTDPGAARQRIEQLWADLKK